VAGSVSQQSSPQAPARAGADGLFAPPRNLVQRIVCTIVETGSGDVEMALSALCGRCLRIAAELLE